VLGLFVDSTLERIWKRRAWPNSKWILYSWFRAS